MNSHWKCLTYRPRQRHTPRRQQIAVRRLGRQHAVLDLVDELDEVVDLLLQGRVFVVFGFVGVDGLDACAGFDGA